VINEEDSFARGGAVQNALSIKLYSKLILFSFTILIMSILLISFTINYFIDTSIFKFLGYDKLIYYAC
jgi:hypothetical protein